MTFGLTHLKEPRLLFGYNQGMEDPRDGLALFGPLDKGKQSGFSTCVVGTKGGIRRFEKWVKEVSAPISDIPTKRNKPPFPGYQSVFAVKWLSTSALSIEIDSTELMSE